MSRLQLFFFLDTIVCIEVKFLTWKTHYISRMFIEILDNDHIHGKPHYFGSPRLRDDFINNIKEHILRINLEELLQIQNYWEANN